MPVSNCFSHTDFGGPATYRIVVQGRSAGDHVIAVQLASDEVPKPVVKQESTKVYADE